MLARERASGLKRERNTLLIVFGAGLRPRRVLRDG
jgi:hypothetical protein